LLRLCLNVILQVRSLPPYRREPFLGSTSRGQDVVLDRQVIPLPQIFLSSIFHLKLFNRIRNSNYNKVKFPEHFTYLILVCDVLCVITFGWYTFMNYVLLIFFVGWLTIYLVMGYL
jgi:hypothetical protein